MIPNTGDEQNPQLKSQYNFADQNQQQPFTPPGYFYPSPSSMTEEEIIYNSLKDCLNYVLSKEYISVFFPNALGQLQYSQEVFIDIKDILNVSLIGAITNDVGLITRVLKENNKYSLDEEHNILKVQLSDRTMIMLRDIPDNTPQEEIKELFAEYAEHIVNMQPEIGNNYYVNFDSSEVAQNAFNYVREKKFRDKTVGCCIKSSHNFYPSYYPPQPEYEQENPYRYTNDYYKDGNKKRYNNRNRKKDSYRKVGQYNNNNTTSNINPGVRGRGKRREADVQVHDLGEYWPPLPNPRISDAKRDDMKKYTRDQIVLIVNSIKDVKAPSWENPDCAAIAEQSNTELEIGKVIPHTTKNDWVEKGKNKRNKRQRTPSVKKEESNVQNKDNDTSVPVWPMGGRQTKRKEYVRKQSTETQTSEFEENTQEGNDTDNSQEKSSQPRYADIVKSSTDPQNKSPTTQHSTDTPETPPLETTPQVSSQETH